MPLPEGCGHLLPCWDTLVKSSTCLQVRQTRINAGRSGNLAPNWRFSPDALNRLPSQKRTMLITGGNVVLVGSEIGSSNHSIKPPTAVLARLSQFGAIFI
jgi:hypothetical protein